MSARQVVCPDCDDGEGLVVVERIERQLCLDRVTVAEDGTVSRSAEDWADPMVGTEVEVGLACCTCGWRSVQSHAAGHVDRVARHLIDARAQVTR